MANLIRDIKTAAKLFVDMRKAEKGGCEIVLRKTVEIPMIKSGGFYNTVEGSTLHNLGYNIANKAQIAFSKLSEEEKHRLQFAPKDGEFVERAKMWKNILIVEMSERECHIAMRRILEWYLHIKQMNRGMLDE